MRKETLHVTRINPEGYLRAQSELKQLYRLIEGACDQLMGVKSARAALDVAANLRARAQQIRDGRTTDQLTIEDGTNG